ncbi:MAG: GDYXXLXY domain-containing protein [Candidatus Omnitrophica bacterium]|nr:GDYXXLXY domain-containing protein [Candidatus Omnitrophota bacterium]
MNKKIIFFFIAVLWVIVVAAMIISKQSILRKGKAVLLETLPVDPRDLLRGDYVILRYKISTLDLDQVKSEKPYYKTGEVIYVRLEPRDKFWEATAVEVKRSADSGIYIRGKVGYCYRKELGVIYGIESYFVPEGEGREIERNIRREKSSVNVEAVVDSKGNALIKKVYIDKNS